MKHVRRGEVGPAAVAWSVTTFIRSENRAVINPPRPSLPMTQVEITQAAMERRSSGTSVMRGPVAGPAVSTETQQSSVRLFNFRYQ